MKLEESVNGLESVTKMLSDGKTPEEILKLALKNFEYEILYTEDVSYKCKCSRSRTAAALSSIGDEDLREIVADGKDTEVICHFCNKQYVFTVDDIQKILDEKFENL